MGAFLRRVDALHDGVQKDVLKLLLFLGGQRPMQLLRSGLVRKISAKMFKTVTSAALLDVAFVEYRHADPRYPRAGRAFDNISSVCSA
jgi:hypothetical protein